MRYILQNISELLKVKKNPMVRMLTRMTIASIVGFASVVYGATISVKPDADSFVRAQAPASNYGGGGALSVSGAAAVNGSGQQNGAFDTLMRFPMNDAVATLDATLGQDWIVTGARLVVTEMAMPDNAIFNLGIGEFEIRWIGTNNWTEGTGRPNAPTSDGVTWQDLPGILNSNLDVSLGVFTNSGSNAQISFLLTPADSLIADVRSGGELSLYLTAVSPDSGFTFNSRNFGNTNAQPFLELNAVANPGAKIDSIVISNLNAIVSFDTVSNWSYCVLGADNLSGPWSNLWAMPAQSTNGSGSFVEEAVRGQRYYRLKASPNASSGFQIAN
jgi:hypothetical protein